MKNSEIKIKFWIELWEDLINNFLKRSYGLTLYSPHILIEDIIVEIEENQFRNKENRKYFYSNLSDFLKNDEVIQNHFKSEFTLLRKDFNSDKTNYTLALCKKINESFKKGIYFQKTLVLTEKILLEDTELDIKFVNKINYYSQSLIVELIRKSYALEDVKKFLKNIFDVYHYHGDSLITDFPHNIDYSEYKDENEKIDFKKAEEVVKNIMDNLSFKDRIKKLSYYYSKKTEKVKYIFFIKGIKGEIDKTIFGVNFYNINQKRFTEEDRTYDSEDLQKHLEKDKYLQAAVEIDYLLPKSSLKFAKSKIENALDILACYIRFKTDVALNESNYIIVNKDNRLIFSTSGRGKDDIFMNYHDALNFNELENHIDSLKEFSFLWNSKKNSETVSKIKNALHWYRKGEQSSKEADKMLNYWIAIENLFNSKEDIKKDIFSDIHKSKFDLIQEIIASEQIFKFVYEYGWELYHYFSHKERNRFEKTDIPENLVELGQLNPEVGTSIYLENFIKILPELRVYEKNLFILDKIDAVIKFYSDSSFTKSEILNHIGQVKNDVLMIYRFRNLIVHNAHFDNTLLPYFVWKTKSYCGGILRKFINSDKEDSKLSDIIFEIFIEKEKFLLDFEKGNINLFEKKN
ncbi:hypothetical protein [Gelidibacter salicanalis]|uniref:Apea-like HEPN domain-containing protein n=1 Tax=Gelidibacter salicanalis TaxID=291193 RepID=A0A934NI46_9FLAO|nr:hypothetical protein [Gelidibacter salicanalis]MBJ7881626.1 hypothetical protein [Gelidibacter salicanalis]